jgi:hypothetical protein
VRLFLVIALFLALCFAQKPHRFNAKDNQQTDASVGMPKSFDRVFIMNFENQPEWLVSGNAAFAHWAAKGVMLSNYYAATHPSQPNYWSQSAPPFAMPDVSPHTLPSIATVAGDYFGINSDDNFNLNHTTLADLLEAKGLTWRSYQEDYPGGCNPAKTIGKYWRKHNPFISFDSIRTNPTRCSYIVNSAQFDADLKSNKLPTLSYYTPNIDNDGHDTGLAFAGKYLDSWLTPRFSLFPNNTLIVLTWDEDNYLSFNHIYTALLGSMVTTNTTDNSKYDHFSLLRTIEDNFQLGNLGRRDAKAVPFKCLRPL